jgi:hypothetical protein
MLNDCFLQRVILKEMCSLIELSISHATSVEVPSSTPSIGPCLNGYQIQELKTSFGDSRAASATELRRFFLSHDYPYRIPSSITSSFAPYKIPCSALDLRAATNTAAIPGTTSATSTALAGLDLGVLDDVALRQGIRLSDGAGSGKGHEEAQDNGGELHILAGISSRNNGWKWDMCSIHTKVGRARLVEL